MFAAAFAFAIGVVIARGLWRSLTNRSDPLGRVSQRWLAVHRTEN
jgi:HAMP domain-containing protein